MIFGVILKNLLCHLAEILMPFADTSEYSLICSMAATMTARNLLIQWLIRNEISVYQAPRRYLTPTRRKIAGTACSASPRPFHSTLQQRCGVYSLRGVRNAAARAFYESEALRGGWTIRQLDRQIQSQFYERTALSRDKATVLRAGTRSLATDTMTPDEEIKNPYLLEFLGLEDEYSETELEGALIGKLQAFLLELGGDFTFVGRQHRLRVGDEWYRVDLVFFHRRL
jgi:predicted nuclease of restriction endonuclease-like (RecB) superfamily